MSDLAAIITALGGLLTVLGGGVGVVYRRVMKRLDTLEADLKEARRDLDECERKHAESERHRAQDYSKLSAVMGWLGLSLNEIERIDPENGFPLQIRTALNLSFPVDPHIPAALAERLPK